MEHPIVVVDDEPGVLAMLEDLLAMEGFGVLCFERPDQLQTWKPAARPSLFLIDIMLPGMSGVELAEQLRAEHFSDIPMIAMSASSFMVKTARATGLFAETVRKPFDVGSLLELVERYVG
mgnify:CR=1 FL=1